MFAWADVVIGIAIPLVLLGLWQRGTLDPLLWRIYWIGTAFGLLGEGALHVFGLWSAERPLFRHLFDWPLPPVTMPIIQAFWDGLLLMGGVLLLRQIRREPLFDRFRWPVWCGLLAWGIGSALLVEVAAILSRAWVYILRPWNPVLFSIAGEPITAVPLVGWAVGVSVFYGLMLATTTPSLSLRSSVS